MKELGVGDPTLLFDSFLVEDGDMGGSAAKADPA
jgi:hypothetical protein